MRLGMMGVDPRGCGGAQRAIRLARQWWGRSPRVRGSLCRLNLQGWRMGSIPAGAGEPANTATKQRDSWVDPRGCGGATPDFKERYFLKGRSPRVRGSRLDPGRGCGDVGSIPAGAGEPCEQLRQFLSAGVDPRGCGGAARRRWDRFAIRGRSPRVRGSLLRFEKRRDGRGSIPAGAGEPLGRSRRSSSHRVDPRGCGGAGDAENPIVYAQGRSPRVRGSRCAARCADRRQGSIPAGAGEPVLR